MAETARQLDIQARGWMPPAGRVGNLLFVPLPEELAWALGEVWDVDRLTPLQVSIVVERAVDSYIEDHAPGLHAPARDPSAEPPIWMPAAARVGNLVFVPLSDELAWRLDVAWAADLFAVAHVADAFEEAIDAFVDDKMPDRTARDPE